MYSVVELDASAAGRRTVAGGVGWEHGVRAAGQEVTAEYVYIGLGTAK